MDTKIFIKKNFLCSLFQVIFPKNIYTIIFDYIEILNQVASFSLSEIKNYHQKGSHKLYDCDFYYSCNCICKCTCNCNCFNSRNICYIDLFVEIFQNRIILIQYDGYHRDKHQYTVYELKLFNTLHKIDIIQLDLTIVGIKNINDQKIIMINYDKQLINLNFYEDEIDITYIYRLPQKQKYTIATHL